MPVLELIVLVLAIVGPIVAVVWRATKGINALWQDHEKRIRDLEEVMKLRGLMLTQNTEDHAVIKTGLGNLIVKVDKTANDVSGIVLYLRMEHERKEGPQPPDQT